MSIKYWWSDDLQWFCILADDGASQTTVSLARQEALELSMEADPKFADMLGEGRKRALELLEEARISESWHSCVETMMTIAGLPLGLSPPEALVEFQQWLNRGRSTQ